MEKSFCKKQCEWGSICGCNKKCKHFRPKQLNRPWDISFNSVIDKLKLLSIMELKNIFIYLIERKRVLKYKRKRHIKFTPTKKQQEFMIYIFNKNKGLQNDCVIMDIVDDFNCSSFGGILSTLQRIGMIESYHRKIYGSIYKVVRLTDKGYKYVCKIQNNKSDK